MRIPFVSLLPPLLVLVFFLGACSQFPQLDQAVSAQARAADYPTLVPTQSLVAQAGEVRITPQSNDSFLARLNALNARAAALRRPLIDSRTRARMARGITL